MNNDNNGHLIYDLSKKKIVVTMNYQSVLVPTDLFDPTNRTESSNNKIQVDHFDVDHSIVRIDYSNSNEYKKKIQTTSIILKMGILMSQVTHNIWMI